MYIDTSFLVAFYVPEKLTPQVDNLILSADRVYISAITKIELLSALNKKVRMGFFTHRETRIAFNKFEEHISEGLYKQVGITSNHFRSATDVLFQTNAALRTLDAIHLGIVRTEHIKIASNDSILLKAAKEFNIQTVKI